MYRILGIALVAGLLAACQSTDKMTEICEQNNTECQQRCVITNANFSQTRLATQPVGACDRGCENTYQTCLKRQENKSIRGTSAY